jgi:hypothetical protein
VGAEHRAEAVEVAEKVGLAREYDARRWRRLDKQFAAIKAKMAPLLGAVPFFIPRHIDSRDEVVAFDSISTAVCQHRPLEFGTFGDARAGPAMLRRRQHDGAPFRREDEVPSRMQSEYVLRRLVVHNHLP